MYLCLHLSHRGLIESCQKCTVCFLWNTRNRSTTVLKCPPCQVVRLFLMICDCIAIFVNFVEVEYVWWIISLQDIYIVSICCLFGSVGGGAIVRPQPSGSTRTEFNFNTIKNNIYSGIGHYCKTYRNECIQARHASRLRSSWSSPRIPPSCPP